MVGLLWVGDIGEDGRVRYRLRCDGPLRRRQRCFARHTIGQQHRCLVHGSWQRIALAFYQASKSVCQLDGMSSDKRHVSRAIFDTTRYLQQFGAWPPNLYKAVSIFFPTRCAFVITFSSR
jgi:hypothetical protein